MADENVHVHIRITSDKREIAATRRELERLSLQARALNDDFADLNDTLDGNNDRQRRLQRNSQGTNRALDSNGSAADRLGKKMRKSGKDMDFLDKSRKMLAGGLKTGLKFALIGATIEMVAMGAAIASVNALFAIGSASMKVYNFAMSGVAAGIAVGIGALATFAAAQRQYNAAINGFSYKSAPALGAGVNQAQGALRNLTSDSRVAVFGMQNLNAAFANISKSTDLTKPLQDALAGVGDFAVAAGGDIGKNFAAAAEFVGLLQKEGKLTDDLLGSAEKVGPKFAEALKASGKTGASEIMSLLSSGALAESAGVSGALKAVNGTLMGQFKGFFTEMQSRFADLGQSFIPGVTKAFSQIQVIARTAFTRISGTMSGINSGGFFDGFVKVTEKLTDMFVNFFDKYLPKAQTMFSGVGSLFNKMRGWWNSFVDGMRSLQEASRIINSAFGTAFSQLFEGFGGSIKMFAKLMEDNEPKFIEFGNALAGAFSGIQDFFNGFKEFFVSNLPVISTLIDGLGSILGLIGKVVGGISQIGKGVGSGVGGSILSLMAVTGLALGAGRIAPNSKMGRAGNFIGRRAGIAGTPGGGGPGMTGPMTMTAATVYLTTSRLIQNSSGMNRYGGVGNTPYGPMPLGGTPPPTRGQRIRQGAGQHFKNNAGGYQMGGAMLGLAAMSQFANEDANPYLAAGGMLSMVNPLLGLGVGAAGTAATAKTAGGGAIAGAVGGGALTAGGFMLAGATMGSAVPILGTAIGAAVGAALGGTIGYARSQAAERDQARAVARGEVQGTYGGMFANQLFGSGGPEGARQAISQAADVNDRMQTVFRQFQEMEDALGGEDVASNEKIVEQMKKTGIVLSQQEEDLLKNQAHLSSYFSSMQKQTEGLIGMEGPLQHFEQQTGELAGITGTTTKEMSDLALKMGVDLLDPTRTLTQNLKDLGLATVLTGEQIAGVQRKIYSENIAKVFGQAEDFQKAQIALDQAAEGIRQSGTGTTGAQAAGFARTLLEQELSLAGGDVTKAMARIQSGFLGADNNLTGDAFKDALSPVFGLEEIFRKSVEGDAQGRSAQQMLLEAISKSLQEINQKTATNTLTAIAGAGSQVAGGPEATYLLNTQIQERLGLLTQATMGQGALAGMGAEAAQAQLTGLSGLAGQISQGQLRGLNGEILTGEILNNRIETELSGYGIVTDIMNQPAAGEGLGGTTKEMHDAIINAAKEGIGKTPDWLATAPSWYTSSSPAWHTQQPSWYSGGKVTITQDGSDTSTPRAFGDATSSRLGRTMARHSYFDGTLPGKRTVTSAWRNFGLGSLKSDHLTGNAYDLTGQNLVGYANAVNGSGGFAEFHGSGGDRHLHVVPGQTPIGDSVSSMSPMVSGGSGGGSYAYTINVYPSAGQDSAAIAQEVMNRIEAKEKSVRERS